MCLVVDLHESLRSNVGIFLGRGEALMAEKFLYPPEVGATTEEMGGEGVAECMRASCSGNASLANLFAHDPADTPRG